MDEEGTIEESLNAEDPRNLDESERLDDLCANEGLLSSFELMPGLEMLGMGEDILSLELLLCLSSINHAKVEEDDLVDPFLRWKNRESLDTCSSIGGL